jgi:hypothetical protein
MMRPPFSNVFFASGGPEAFLLPSSEIHIQNPVKRIAPVEFGQEGGSGFDALGRSCKAPDAPECFGSVSSLGVTLVIPW